MHKLKSTFILERFPRYFTRCSLTVLLSVVLLSDAVGATSRIIPLQIAQQTTTPQNAKRVQGQQLLQEAQKLYEQGTAESQQQAIAKYAAALKIWQEIGDRNLAANTLIAIGKVYFQLSEAKKALDFYNQGLAIQVAQKDLQGQADTLYTIGRIYAGLGEPQKALNSLNQALEIQRARKELAGQGETLTIIGAVYFSVGDNQKALNSLNQALQVQQQAQNNLSGAALALNFGQQASTLSVIAGTYNALGESQKAIEYYNQTRSLFQKAGNRNGEAEILNQISLVYDSLGEKQKALDALNQALVIQRSDRNRTREAFTLGNIAAIYQSFGDYQQALNSYNQALELSRQVGDRSIEAGTLQGMALVYSFLGDYNLSVETYNQALEIFKQIGDRSSQAQTLDNIGSVYRLAEDYPKALDYYNQALTLWREQGAVFQEFATLTGVIRVDESLKDYPKALENANRVLTLSRQQKSGFIEASALALLGRIYQASGDYQKALDFSTQAVAGWRKLKRRNAEAKVLGNIGNSYNALKQPQQAIATYNQQLTLLRTLGDRTSEADTLYYIALTERDRGNLQAARTQIESTIKIVEDTRSKVTSQELRTSYFATVQKYYEFYIDLLMQLHKQNPSQGYAALALQASERSRARGLVELLTEANVDIKKDVDPKLLTQENRLQWQIAAKEKKLSELSNQNNTPQQLTTLTAELTNLLDQQEQLKTKIRAQNPEYAALKYPNPITLPQIQQQLDKDTLLLEYSLGEKRSYLWLITPNSLNSYQLPGREQIEKVAKNFYNNYLKNPGIQGLSPEEIARAADDLSKLILAPVADKLGQKRLVVVGDDALQYIPFAALTSGKSAASKYQPLVVNHEIISLPSASTIAILRKELKGRAKAPKNLAILADPVFSTSDERVSAKPSNILNDPNLQLQASALNRSAGEINRSNVERLKGTRTEAQEILKLVPPSERLQALDFDANYNWATSKQLSQYRIIHFATHGLVNSKEPELSGIVLSLIDKQGQPQRGFLRLDDIFNLNFPAELVVLSACKTGLGKEVKGEGLVGLTRGLMYAGAARVVVSLWNVDDEATSSLMQQFYSQMLQQGKSPAAALRSAQIQLSQQEQWRNPYFWAGFTLLGEWRE
ncbi:tetratricopeptide repeat protein [Dendronalium sp. ChiSLP03b]|uniref:tetratricopeptide repeat protein n=1 Tax=Dendronalium sp. ChiSLP03b TaxID=3075381 RepID=UPI002AD1EA09|nr:tetratricopeptide repeat protein [Dendronalium sp. ChiSLP03b]MDZ8206282.1 tetratricopeptide repeat protein [Dendronalium sp. ChiSLP03b]